MQMAGVLFAVLFHCLPIAFDWPPTTRGVQQRIVFTTTLWCWDCRCASWPTRSSPSLFAFTLGSPRMATRLPYLVLCRSNTAHGVTITSVIRMVIIVRGSFGPVVSNDASFNVGFVASAIETNLALSTASTPAPRPTLRPKDRGGWLPRFGRSTCLEMASTAPHCTRSVG